MKIIFKSFVVLIVSFLLEGATTACSAELVNFPHPPEAHHLLLRGINNAGQIVGEYEEYIGYDAISHKFLWSKGSFTLLNIPNESGYLNATSHGMGINNVCQIVGSTTKDGNLHGFLWEKGTYIPLDIPGATSTIPRSINDAGQVVGYYNDGTANHGFILDINTGIYDTLNGPTGSGFNPIAINDIGQVVGGAAGYFLWDGANYIPLSVGGDVTGINDAGQICGSIWHDDRMQGFLWDKGKYSYIRVPNYTDTLATGINDKGQIVGSAIHYRLEGYVLNTMPLTPVPSTMLLLGSGLLGVLGLRRFRKN